MKWAVPGPGQVPGTLVPGTDRHSAAAATAAEIVLRAAAGTEGVRDILQNLVLCHTAVELCIARAVINAHGHVDKARAIADGLDVIRTVLMIGTAAATAAAAAFTLIRRADALAVTDTLT